MNTQLFLQTLPFMGLGMAGIFIVTIIIILSIALLNKLTSGYKENKDEQK